MGGKVLVSTQTHIDSKIKIIFFSVYLMSHKKIMFLGLIAARYERILFFVSTNIIFLDFTDDVVLHTDIIIFPFLGYKLIFVKVIIIILSIFMMCLCFFVHEFHS